MDLWPRKAFGEENKFWIKPMDPEREGDAPSLTPSLKEGRVNFKQRGGEEELKGPLQLDPLRFECWQKTWSSSPSHCESRGSHSRTSEKIWILFLITFILKYIFLQNFVTI